MNKRYLLFAGILLNMTMAAGCGQLLNASVGMEVKQEDAIVQNLSIQYEITDTDKDIDVQNATEIQMNNLEENTLKINEGGNYILTGKNDNCNIVINAFDDEKIHLFLKNAELSAESGPVIYAEKAGKVIITVIEGTENMISDSPEYATETEACIFSNCDLTINGSGKLFVYGYYHDAIRSKDRLKLIETNLFVKAKNDALRGNDGVIIENSTTEIESEGNGILTNSEVGCVIVQGGACKITAGENAIAADSYASIKDCDYDLYSVLETVKCSGIKEIDGEN